MPSKEQFIEGIIQSCQEIFEVMLPLKLSANMLKRPLPFNYSVAEVNEDIFASIGLTGANSGTISMYISEQMALHLASLLMEENYQEFNHEVYESIGEMINMIAGGLKNRLSTEEQDLYDLSSPIIISGKNKA